ncbi:MAG: SIS domain-containing protein [Bacillota bacterium]|nr:SIS domain-containing protein [Bacillota bacterium]
MTLMEQEIKEQPQVLKDCIKNNHDVLLRISDAVKCKKPTYAVVAARGTSDHAATYFKYLAGVYAGMPVTLSAPSITTAYGSKLKLNGAIVIGVSQSGKAADVLAVLDQAKEQGAITIAVTNFDDSPLAKIADFHLNCTAGLERSVAATKTYTAQLMLLAQVVVSISGNEELAKKLDKVPDLVERTLSDTTSLENLVSRFRYMNECFVLGRGYLYPAALEAALKIQETCYVRARGYSIADFHHGPFAMVNRDIPVFFMGADVQTDKDTIEMIDKTKETGAEITVITNKKEIANKADFSIMLPPEAEGDIAVFAAAAVSQLFACRLSVLRGNNPDTPRGLNKVTITK